MWAVCVSNLTLKKTTINITSEDISNGRELQKSSKKRRKMKEKKEIERRKKGKEKERNLGLHRERVEGEEGEGCP